MKIETTTTIIECTAEELRQSNSLSDSFYNALRKAFNSPCNYHISPEEPGEPEPEK
jgi:hypothetical protein